MFSKTELRASASAYRDCSDVRDAVNSVLTVGELVGVHDILDRLGIYPVLGTTARKQYGVEFKPYDWVYNAIIVGVAAGDLKKVVVGKSPKRPRVKYEVVRELGTKPTWEDKLRAFLKTSGPVTQTRAAKELGASYNSLYQNTDMTGITRLTYLKECGGLRFMLRLFGGEHSSQAKILLDTGNPVNAYRFAKEMVGRMKEYGMCPSDLPLVEKYLSHFEAEGLPRYAADVVRKYCTVAPLDLPVGLL